MLTLSTKNKARNNPDDYDDRSNTSKVILRDVRRGQGLPALARRPDAQFEPCEATLVNDVIDLGT
jgi:hypothetical protein